MASIALYTTTPEIRIQVVGQLTTMTLGQHSWSTPG